MSDEIEHDKPDTLTALRAENERLRVALETTTDDCKNAFHENERLRVALRNIIAFHEITFVNDKGLEKAVLRTARAALEEAHDRDD